MKTIEDLQKDTENIRTAWKALIQPDENGLGKLAKAKSQYDHLDKMEKVILASLILKQEGKSFSEKEAKARDSEEYRSFLKGLQQANGAYTQARAELDYLSSQQSVNQSFISLQRELANLK